jgi:RNAse (barnase) inhibitor barstar
MKRANMTTLDKLAGYVVVDWPVNIHFAEGDEAQNDAHLRRAFDSLVEVRNRWGDLVGYAPYADAVICVRNDWPLDVSWLDIQGRKRQVRARAKAKAVA